jgi:hypothetical protein
MLLLAMRHFSLSLFSAMDGNDFLKRKYSLDHLLGRVLSIFALIVNYLTD